MYNLKLAIVISILMLSACGQGSDTSGKHGSDEYTDTVSPWSGTIIVNRSEKYTDEELAKIIDYEWRAVKECLDMDYSIQTEISFEKVRYLKINEEGNRVLGLYSFENYTIRIAIDQNFEIEWRQVLRHELQHHIRHLDGDTYNNGHHYVWWNCDYVYPE